MKDTSANYKLAVYSKSPYNLYARQFSPVVKIKIIDVSSGTYTYVFSTKAFYSQGAQIANEGNTNDILWGTLEDFQFLLNSTAKFMPDTVVEIQQHNNGWVSEIMSDASGDFVEGEVYFIRQSSVKRTSIGCTLYFDDKCDSYPVDFNIVYYRSGVEIARDEIRGNYEYIYSSAVGAVRYDQMQITFLSTSKPYRRVHLMNDFPGVIITYDEASVMTISVTRSIDVFCEELVTSEADITVKNTTHLIDILNKTGMEKYLQKKQPVTMKLNLVYPDDTYEEVSLGSWLLYSWNSTNGTLAGTFTVRDYLEQLVKDDYIKGTYDGTAHSLGDLAEEVFAYVGITDYTIDDELYAIFTKAPLPIAKPKELLRLIAQAGQSLLIPTDTGGYHLRYYSPLLTATNLFTNAVFDTATGWTLSGSSLSSTYLKSGLNSVIMPQNSYVSQSVAGTAGHTFYVRVYVYTENDLTGNAGSAAIYNNDVAVSALFEEANINTDEWVAVSAIITAETLNALKVNSTLTTSIYVDSFMCIDLTALYGASTPDKTWCDENIQPFATTSSVPVFAEEAAVDTLDYKILMKKPDIKTADIVGAIETNIYTLVADSTTSEVYSSIREINGTETFDVQFDNIAKNCSVAVVAVDEDGTPTGGSATVLSSTFYARAATLRIQAVSYVQITITGTAVNAQTSLYHLDTAVDPADVADAITVTRDNALITSSALAANLSLYAAYWYAKNYRYSFDWRGNPALEMLDPITVHDDFNNDNTVLITADDLEYNTGVLSESSEGMY